MATALERVTFFEAVMNCILRLEGDADALASLLDRVLALTEGTTDPAWLAWRVDAERVRARQAAVCDRW